MSLVIAQRFRKHASRTEKPLQRHLFDPPVDDFVHDKSFVHLLSSDRQVGGHGVRRSAFRLYPRDAYQVGRVENPSQTATVYILDDGQIGGVEIESQKTASGMDPFFYCSQKVRDEIGRDPG